jgi:hypothetical protein
VFGVVATIGQKPLGTVAATPPQRRDLVDNCDRVAAVVVVRGTQNNRERDAAAVADEVQLRGRTAAIGRVSADFSAPLFAGTVVESTIARSQPIFPALANRRCNRSTNSGQTPARCH